MDIVESASGLGSFWRFFAGPLSALSGRSRAIPLMVGVRLVILDMMSD